MEDWSAERAQAGDPAVRVGVGVHYGEAFCGAIGDETRLEYTVLGDTVNVAARLEELTKSIGLPLVVSKDVIDRAGIDEEFHDGTATDAAADALARLDRTLPGRPLAALADHVRKEKIGDKAYYVHSLRLSQTNVCYVGCTFCGFQRHIAT